MSVEGIARAFHERYEQLAPDHGYRTREASAKPWEQVPQNNRKLMESTVQALLDDDIIIDPEAYESRSECRAS